MAARPQAALSRYKTDLPHKTHIFGARTGRCRLFFENGGNAHALVGGDRALGNYPESNGHLPAASHGNAFKTLALGTSTPRTIQLIYQQHSKPKISFYCLNQKVKGVKPLRINLRGLHENIDPLSKVDVWHRNATYPMQPLIL